MERERERDRKRDRERERQHLVEILSKKKAASLQALASLGIHDKAVQWEWGAVDRGSII